MKSVRVLSVIVLAMIATQAVAGDPSAPVLADAIFWGGSGDQSGTSIAIANDHIYVGGSAPAWSTALLLRFALPPEGGSPATLSPAGNSYLHGIAAMGDLVFGAGNAYPPRCGAFDGAGGTEWKALFTRADAATGAFLGCQSTNMFGYRGGEGYYGLTSAEEAGEAVAFAVGGGETCGWGYASFVIYKYDAAGLQLAAASEPSAPWWGACIGHSNLYGATVFDDSVYGVGRKGSWNYTDYKPLWVKLAAADLGHEWLVLSPENGELNAVTELDGFLYGAGSSGTFNNPGLNGRDFLVEKYRDDGVRQWRSVFGGAAEDYLEGVTAVGERLFAVGHTLNATAGGRDAAILELDPETGNVLHTILWGGAQDDTAYDAATDGTDLYVVVTSRSFASTEGNLVGQDDVVLLRFSLNQPPEADAGYDMDLEATSSDGVEVTLDGSGSSDPDGDPLDFTWKENGTVIATGETPTVTLGLGMHTIELTVEDPSGETDSDEVVIIVEDTTAPEVTVTLSPTLLWPPNHKLVTVTVTVTATDAVDATPIIVLTLITSNEPDNGLDDGDTVNDIQDADVGTFDTSVTLRAERSGIGSGRTYTVTYTATDDSGNGSTASASVVVPLEW